MVVQVFADSWADGIMTSKQQSQMTKEEFPTLRMRIERYRRRMKALFRRAAAILLLVLAPALLPPAAFAGSIAYTFSLTGNELTMTLQGDTSAYYPAAFRLAGSGDWEKLEPLGPMAEQTKGVAMRFRWPDQGTAPIEAVKAFMVRFFDSSGVGFGQVAFFAAPPAAARTTNAAYVDGQLRLHPPDDPNLIRATWVIAPLEEGIAPIAGPLSFVHRQPAARRIDWGRVLTPVAIDNGPGQPLALLLHETPAGFESQTIQGGRSQPGGPGAEQRTPWLKSAALFYAAGLVLLLAGLAFAVFAAVFARVKGWPRSKAA